MHIAPQCLRDWKMWMTCKWHNVPSLTIKLDARYQNWKTLPQFFIVLKVGAKPVKSSFVVNSITKTVLVRSDGFFNQFHTWNRRVFPFLYYILAFIFHHITFNHPSYITQQVVGLGKRTYKQMAICSLYLVLERLLFHGLLKECYIKCRMTIWLRSLSLENRNHPERVHVSFLICLTESSFGLIVLSLTFLPSSVQWPLHFCSPRQTKEPYIQN